MQHGQRVAHTGKAHTNAALGHGLVALLRQGPEGHVQHVIKRTHLQGHGPFKGFKVKRCGTAPPESVAHKTRQDDGPQVTAAVRRQRLFATGVGGGDVFAVVEVVVLVDAPQKQDAGLGKVVGRLHDRVPQLARRHGRVHPQPISALVGALRLQGYARPRAVHQLPRAIGLNGFDERIGHAHRHVEIVPAAGRALGGDELLHIGVVDAQHAHLRATARARAFDRGAGLVEHIDVAAGPRRHGMGAFDFSAAWADAREVIAHAATAPHGFGRFAQGFVNAGVAFFVHALNAVTHGLHKAVDERGLDVCARCTHDATGADGTRMQVGQEQGFVFFTQGRGLDRGQGTGHAAVQVFDAAFAGFEVFLAQHIQADGLQGGDGRGQGGGSFALHGSE